MTAPDKIWIEPAWAETFARPDGDPVEVAYIPEAIAQAAVRALAEGDVLAMVQLYASMKENDL